jgi:hypothetical protein
MGKITIDRDQLVELIQTFYNQGFDDAGNSPVPFDIKEAVDYQLNLLELRQAEHDLIEWEKKEGLFRDTLPDNI